ncbi:Homeobox protein Mohawk [Sciurus carolinensis]|uniref:Homeobox protein Mohawk n=1 Tax=Sciurus carolinensis TaxID=30640 RepID=A0AA41N9V1_SCICA|nr:Homeobox protein Mohawk [Sciurus carolinensis]
MVVVFVEWKGRIARTRALLRSSWRPGSKALRPRHASLPTRTMNTIVFNKLSGAVLFEDRGAPERERGGRPYGGVLDSPHARPEVGIPDGPPLKDNLGLRHRRTGVRQNGRKVRHKRQALQDMARPLKQWLYKHRDNPYPTKTEKILLALGSQMTLVQVLQKLPVLNATSPGPSFENQRACCSILEPHIKARIQNKLQNYQ